MYAHVLLIFWQ